jgi:hypothetical protein
MTYYQNNLLYKRPWLPPYFDVVKYTTGRGVLKGIMLWSAVVADFINTLNQ